MQAALKFIYKRKAPAIANGGIFLLPFLKGQ